MKKGLLLFCLCIPSTCLAWHYPTTELSVGEFCDRGCGIETDPYIVTTAQQLANLSHIVNNGEKFNDKFFKLGNDIVLNTSTNPEEMQPWIPIGNLQKPFCGNFDGNGHTVKGLYINDIIPTQGRYYTSSAYAGLFGYAETSIFSNFKFENATIILSVTTDKYGPDTEYDNLYDVSAGALVGLIEAGSVISCSASSEVSITCDFEFNDVLFNAGCLIGAISGGNEVSSCSADGSVSLDFPKSSGIMEKGIGGIAGYLGTKSLTTLTNRANVSVLSGNTNAGGIAANISNQHDSNNTFSNLINEGKITCSGGISAGLAFWFIAPAIEDCHNKGEVTHGNGGYSYGFTSDAQFMVMKNCTNSGYIQGPGMIGYGDYLGLLEDCTNYADTEGAGIMSETGPDGTTFRRCVNHGKAHGAGILACASTPAVFEECHNYGDITGVAGIVGNRYYYPGAITMKSCSNTGRIDGSKTYFAYNIGMDYVHTYYISFVGGLINFASTVDMIDCTNKGEVISPLIAGGLIGANTDNLNIKNSRNEGNILSRDNPELNISFSHNSIVGGIIGSGGFPSEITDTYNLGSIHVETSKHIDYEPILAGGISGHLNGKIFKSNNSGNLYSNMGYVGGIIGNLSESEIVQSFNTGDISGSADFAGGLIGKCNYSENNKILDCYTACSLMSETGVCSGIYGTASSLDIMSTFAYCELDAHETYPIGFIPSNNEITIENTYYLSPFNNSQKGSNPEKAKDAQAKSASDFASGRVCVALNNGRTTDAPWGQNVGTDPYPILDGSGDPDNVIASIDSINTNDIPDKWTIYEINGQLVVDERYGVLFDIIKSLDKGIYIIVSSDGKPLKLAL